jgi:hypothetical protein
MQLGPLFVLEPEELPSVPLCLDAGARLRVLDEEGRSVRGAWIVASTEEQSASEHRATGGWQPELRVGLTADDGSLTLPRFAEERLRVSLHAPGRVEVSRADFQEGILRLAASSREILRLQVVTPGGGPVSGVLVRSGATLWPAGLTDADGRLGVPIRRD